MSNHRKIRCDSRIGQLTAEEQDEVIAHCDSIKLGDSVDWLKGRFDITITETALSKWLKKKRVERLVATRLDEIRQARDQAMLIGKVVGTATEITDANIALIAQAVFEELVKPPEERDETKLAKYMALAIQLKNQHLKGRAGDLAYERFHFEAARKALAFSGQLKRITESGGDERAKIEEAMVLLFGKPVTVEV